MSQPAPHQTALESDVLTHDAICRVLEDLAEQPAKLVKVKVLRR